jgi:hypothetical protein
MGSLYTFAERRDLVPENCNPARKIETFPEDRRERFLTNWSGLAPPFAKAKRLALHGATIGPP